MDVIQDEACHLWQPADGLSQAQASLKAAGITHSCILHPGLLLSFWLEIVHVQLLHNFLAVWTRHSKGRKCLGILAVVALLSDRCSFDNLISKAASPIH